VSEKTAHRTFFQSNVLDADIWYFALSSNDFKCALLLFLHHVVLPYFNTFLFRFTCRLYVLIFHFSSTALIRIVSVLICNVDNISQTTKMITMMMNTLPQRSSATGCASQNVSPSNWQLWRIDPSTTPLRPTYSRVSPAFPTLHPDDGCSLLPNIVWTFRPFVSLQSASGHFWFVATVWNDPHLHVASAPSLAVKTFLFSRSYQDAIIWLVCYYYHGGQTNPVRGTERGGAFWDHCTRPAPTFYDTDDIQFWVKHLPVLRATVKRHVKLACWTNNNIGLFQHTVTPVPVITFQFSICKSIAV